MYARGKGARLLLGVYVNDLISTSADTEEITTFKGDDGTVAHELHWVAELLFGHRGEADGGQHHVVSGGMRRQVPGHAGMADCNVVHVPMEPRLKLSKESSEPPVDATHYRKIIGGLCYLIHTRPIITFVMGYVSLVHGGAHSCASRCHQAPAVLCCWYTQVWVKVH